MIPELKNRVELTEEDFVKLCEKYESKIDGETIEEVKQNFESCGFGLFGYDFGDFVREFKENLFVEVN